jgi:hypothetical protein
MLGKVKGNEAKINIKKINFTLEQAMKAQTNTI